MNKRPHADCESCPLYRQPLHPEPRNPNARFLAITPAPKSNDIFKGGVDKGDGVALLNKVLKYHAIPTTDVGYIPVVQCAGFDALSATDKNKAVKACSGYVQNFVNNSAPEACLSLGPDASLAACGTRGWTAVRPGPARVREGRLTVPVVPTASPQLCMVQQDKFPFLVTDVGKLINTAVKFEFPLYTVVYNEQDALSYLNSLLEFDRGVFGVDIETASEKDLAFEHPERFEMLCIGTSLNGRNITILAQECLTEQVYVLLKMVMRFHAVLAHNGKFDLQGLRPKLGKVQLKEDTMLASYIFDERSGVHSLKYLGQEYVGAPKWEHEVEQYIGSSKNFALVPKNVLHKYNAYDIHVMFLLYFMYQERFANSDEELRNAYELLIEASNMLQDVEHNGMTIDEEHLEQLSKKFDHDIDVQRRNLAYQALTLSDGVLFDVKLGFNPNSPKQLKEFYESVGIKIASTDEDTLNKIINYAGDAVPDVIRNFSKSILEYRKQIKLGRTYVDGTKKRLYKGRIHPNFLLHGTTTGRLSCRNPNLQNIPRKSPIKRIFVPSGPNRVIAQSDYSQAELRHLCWFAGDTYFTPIFNEGIRDVFDELVPVLYPDCPPKEECDKDIWKENRTMVKTYVYGLGYGRTEYGIAAGFGISVDLALEYMQRFFSVIPEIVEWQERIKFQVKNGDDLVTPFGRHRRYNLITKANERNVMNEALAFLPQSTASDCTIRAAIFANPILEHEFNAKIVNLVHDAIMIDSPQDVVEDALKLVEECMIDSAQAVVGDFVKFATQSSYGNSWEDLV